MYYVYNDRRNIILTTAKIIWLLLWFLFMFSALDKIRWTEPGKVAGFWSEHDGDVSEDFLLGGPGYPVDRISTSYRQATLNILLLIQIYHLFRVWNTRKTTFKQSSLCLMLLYRKNISCSPLLWVSLYPVVQNMQLKNLLSVSFLILHREVIFCFMMWYKYLNSYVHN